MASGSWTFGWDSQGRPIWVGNGILAGRTDFVNPSNARTLLNQSDGSLSPQDRARLQQWFQQNQRPDSSLFKGHATWNNEKGSWDQGANWANILAMGAGAAMAAPAIAGLAGGAGGGAATGVSAETAAVLGGGAVPGVTSAAIPGFAAAVPYAGAATTAGSLAATGAPLASGAIPGGAVIPGAAALPAGVPAGTLAGGIPSTMALGSSGGNVMSKFLDQDNIGDGLESLSRGLSGYADNERENRQMRGNFVQDYDRMRLASEQDQRTSESDAWKKALHTSYVAGGGNPYDPKKGNLPYSYGFGPKAPSPYEQQAANTLQGQLMNRLSGQSKFQPTPLSEYAYAGTGEKIGQYGSLASTGLDLIGRFF